MTENTIENWKNLESNYYSDEHKELANLAAKCGLDYLFEPHEDKHHVIVYEADGIFQFGNKIEEKGYEIIDDKMDDEGVLELWIE